MFGLVGVVYATNDVTREAGASIVLPSDSSSYSIDSGTTVQSFTVNNSNIDFVVEGNSVINLTSGDKKNFNVTNNSQCNMTLTCGVSVSNLFVTCPSNTAQQTITITPSGTCSAPSSGGGGSSYTTPPVVAPVIPVVTPTAPVAAPAASTSTAATPLASVTPSVPLLIQPITMIGFSNPESVIKIKGLTSLVFQQGSSLKFSFQFKNETSAAIPVKVTRQLLNSNGKVVKSSVLSTNLKTNQTLKKTVVETFRKTLPPGDYTEVIKIINSKTKESLEENGFKIAVEKLKKKYFLLTEEIPVATAIAFDENVWKKIKSNIFLPANFKFKYSYTNNTEKKQTVRMVRELIRSDGKVISKSSGKWIMTPGEKDSLTSAQAVAGNLAAGNYIVKISALDWKTGENLAENQFEFSVELK